VKRTWYLAYTNVSVQLFDGALLAVCVIIIRNQVRKMVKRSDIASERIVLQAVAYSIHALLNIAALSIYYNFQKIEQTAPD
jgi:hypothetical protein